MPRTNRLCWGKGLRTKGFWMVVPLIAFTLGAGGCLVTTSKYEAKTKEADTLRDALASASKERNTLQVKYEARITSYNVCYTKLLRIFSSTISTSVLIRNTSLQPATGRLY